MPLETTRQAKISVLLSPGEARRFEAYCQERGHKKSTLIARLIREHLNRERYMVQPVLFSDRTVPGRPHS